MTDTPTQQDTPTEDVELTEMADITVKRVDGVKSAANGTPILMIKSIQATGANDPAPAGPGCGCCDACAVTGGELAAKAAAVLTGEDRAKALALVKAVNEHGEVDEGPDIGTAEQILVLLAKLVAAEAQEMATGEWDESCDIGLLQDAISCMKWFLRNEQEHDATKSAAELAAFEAVAKAEDGALDDAEKAHRSFSADERKRLASEGKALGDGSYPIPDADALRRAAILARSGHGDVTAAKRLIARRAKELGVRNPLEDHSTQKASGDSPVKDEGELLGRVEKAEAEATASRERIEALEAQLAKVLETPIPGGPVITVPHAIRKQRDEESRQIAAARYTRLAETTSDPDMKDFYKARARALAGKED